MTDWYRRETWTKSDDEEFFAKLRRAREDNRAQYLKIQAITLIDTGKRELLPAAEMLLNKILTDYSVHRVQISQSYSSLGTIFRIRGDYEKALDYYRKSMNFEKVFPNVQTGSDVHFAEVVVQAGKTELFDDAEKILLTKVNADELKWPFQDYLVYSLLSVITRFKGDHEQAAVYAELAEVNAKAKTNKLWNSRKNKLGTVKSRIEWLDRLVRHRE